MMKKRNYLDNLPVMLRIIAFPSIVESTIEPRLLLKLNVSLDNPQRDGYFLTTKAMELLKDELKKEIL